MPLDALPAEFLYHIHLDIGATTYVAGGPSGTRVIAEVNGGWFEGPRLKGTVGPAPGGDWVTVRGDGSMLLDVRLLLTTEDGATILVTYVGIMASVDGQMQTRAAPLFETGDERYAWLNQVQGAAIGTASAEGVEYDVYALR
jgi:hypothetical protein